MQSQTKNIVTAILLFTMVVVPFKSDAATSATTYQPQTKQEMIAYLQGRIAQLVYMIQQAERTGLSLNPSQSALGFVSIETHKAIDIEENEAVLRGEAVIYGNTSATVWFEYGKDSKFLDQKTGKVSVRNAYDRAVRKKVTGLDDDRRYYFRIAAEGKDGLVQYGEVYTFYTDDSD